MAAQNADGPPQECGVNLTPHYSHEPPTTNPKVAPLRRVGRIIPFETLRTPTGARHPRTPLLPPRLFTGGAINVFVFVGLSGHRGLSRDAMLVLRMSG
jgi:hypothetical protein